jgi:cleavage and polyadenylation specificity factor subunit 4
MENGLPIIDTTYSSNPASAYGSPRDEDTNRLGLGLSPVNSKGLSVLDAPLPASFDSNGISLAARYGPWPASVPSKFGLESPSASLHSARDARTSETLKLLHTSAFGSNEHLSPSAIGTTDTNGFGSSPPVGSANMGSVLGSDEYFGKRFMHSNSLRYAKPRMISSSVPKIDRDWEAEFMFEEDYVPGALANEVLTPAEKARRGSTTNTVRMTDTMDPGAESLPIGATKFGSPGMAASPSRWGPLFQRQKEEEFDAGGSARSMKHVSAFGHVGSPLRNSSLASAITAGLNGDSIGGMVGNNDDGNESVSALTRQLRETRLAEGGPETLSPHLHPTASRNLKSTGPAAATAGVIGKERERDRGFERHISSGSISSSMTGRFTTPIDEEDSSFVFRMEEEDDSQMRARKRASGGNMGVGSPLSTGWSYANVAAAERAAVSSANANKNTTGGGAEAVGGR